MLPKKNPSMIFRLRPLLRRMNVIMKRIYNPRFPGRRMILLLTTTGRISGRPCITPLQYELIDGFHWVASGWGKSADWLKNIKKAPLVEVQIGGQKYPARADLVEDASGVADFLELRLKRHPLMIGMLLRAQGLPLKYKRQELERLAADIVAVKLIPLQKIK